MWIKSHPSSINKTIKIVFTGILLFSSAPAHTAYGKHHYGYAYNSHSGYNHHNYHSYRHHRSHSHRGTHASASDTAAYVILGVLGIAIIASIFNDRNEYVTTRRTKHRPVQKTVIYKTHAPSLNYTSTLTNYLANAGWDNLEKGKINTALDIFATQTLQNLNSGIPRIGFALAAAANGETDRALRAMRKAVRIDPAALSSIDNNKIKSTLQFLSEQKKISSIATNSDSRFMLATLFYLQRNFTEAEQILALDDQRHSTKNLRRLIIDSQID